MFVRSVERDLLGFLGKKNVRISVLNQFRNSLRSRSTYAYNLQPTHTHKNTIISNNRREQKK
jgi:hypothetical protein